jgi:hypothetical protein
LSIGDLVSRGAGQKFGIDRLSFSAAKPLRNRRLVGEFAAGQRRVAIHPTREFITTRNRFLDEPSAS